MHEALIVLLLKPHKDPFKCDSYHPISLINVDIKILAKVLAKHLNTLVVKLVHSGQGGFIPGRFIRMNNRRLFQNLQYPHECPPLPVSLHLWIRVKLSIVLRGHTHSKFCSSMALVFALWHGYASCILPQWPVLELTSMILMPFQYIEVLFRGVLCNLSLGY